MAAKMVASKTLVNVNNAESVANFESVEKVRGREQKKETIAMTAEKTIVQVPWLETVFRYLAPTKQWKPWMKVLLSTNMKAVNHHAMRLLKKSICPMSQTSRTSG